jgi:Xaa-Pro aminopeptidase
VTEHRLLFSEAEYRARLSAVQAKMRERSIDVLIVDESEHVFHLTGFGTHATLYEPCLVPVEGDPIMVLRNLDVGSFLETTWVTEYVAYRDTDDSATVVAKSLADRGWGKRRIGVELDSHYLTVKQYEAMKQRLAEASFVDFSGVLWELRLRKSPHEIEYLRASARIADQAMLAAIAAVGKGKNEREAGIAASRVYLELGADNARAGLITSGRRSGTIHGELRDNRLESGDFVHMEFVPQVHGYTSRLMRPTVIGQPTADQSETAKRMVEIQDEQLAAMKPGVVAKDVDRICREQFLRQGLREVYDNVTGYTLGYYGNPIRTPRASDFTRAFLPTAEWPLEAGMVFHMYVWARGMAFSESVLVTEGGCERLTKIDRKLFVR